MRTAESSTAKPIGLSREQLERVIDRLIAKSRIGNRQHNGTFCRVVRGGSAGKGYARLRVGDRSILVHRLVAEWWIERPLAPGHLVHHECQTRNCINPLHVREISPEGHGRLPVDERGGCVHGHPLAMMVECVVVRRRRSRDGEVREIRRRQRRCGECHRLRNRKGGVAA